MADATRLGWKERGIGAGVILLFLAAVEIAVRMTWVNPILIPAPTIVAERTWEILAKGEFLKPLPAVIEQRARMDLEAARHVDAGTPAARLR